MARRKTSSWAWEYQKFQCSRKSSRTKCTPSCFFPLFPLGLYDLRNFCSQGTFVKYIQQETGTRVQIKGIGSGFIEQETGQESNEPLYIHITYVPAVVSRLCGCVSDSLLEWTWWVTNTACQSAGGRSSPRRETRTCQNAVGASTATNGATSSPSTVCCV